MSHKNTKVNLDVVIRAQEKYGGLKPVKLKSGTKKEFIWILLDIRLMPGSVHIIQKNNVLDMVKKFPKECNGKVLNPFSSDFQRWEGGLLSDQKHNVFHTYAATRIFISKWSMPYTAPKSLVLARRVRLPNKDDWHKLRSVSICMPR